jgi:hypothetical protein
MYADTTEAFFLMIKTFGKTSLASRASLVV